MKNIQMKSEQVKNIFFRWHGCMATAMMLTIFVAPATAADADKDAKREIHRLQAQFSAAQKEKAVLAGQVDELKKQLSDLGSKSVVLEKKSGGQRKQFTELTEKYQEADKNLQQMSQQFSETSKTLQQLQREKEQEQKQLSGEIQICEKKNLQLHQISVELMDKYKSKGVFSALLQAEPFTQLEKVKIQNVLQEYGDKAEAAKIAITLVPAKVSYNATEHSSGGISAVAPGNKVQAVP